MQHLHRSTLWRRKQKAPSALGRKREGNADESYNLRLLATILAYVAQSGADGLATPNARAWESGRQFVSMAGVRAFRDKAAVLLAEKEMLEHFNRENYAPAGLLIVAACKAFQIDVWRRARRLKGGEGAQAKRLAAAKRIDKKSAAALAKKVTLAANQIARDHRIDKDEAKRLALAALENGEPWIYEFMQADADQGVALRRGSLRPPCPSKIFRISPRMASYWRRFDTFDIGMDLRNLCNVRLPWLMRQGAA